jgi:hypothetical protein
MKFGISAISLLLTAVSALCGFEWDTLDHQFEARPEETQVVAEFNFKNAGPESITIRSVHSGCPCLAAEADKTEYAPGESGRVKATFVFGDRVGRQEHFIEVVSTDDLRSRVVLRLRGDIPRVIDASPRAVNWERTEPPHPKRVRISVIQGFPVKKLTVESSDPNLTGSIEPVIEGLAYDLVVLPVDTGKKIRGLLRVKSDYPSEAPRSVLIYVGFR